MKEESISRFENTQNLYAFIVELYRYIVQFSTAREVRKKHSLFMSKNKNRSQVLKDIDKTISVLVIINPYEFGDWLKIWVKEFGKTEIGADLFCYINLLKIDDIFVQLVANKKIISNRGPLNCDNEYGLYIKNKTTFWTEKFKKGKIRKGRQTTEFDVNSLNGEFNNFEIIDNTNLFGYNLEVRGYNRFPQIYDRLKVGIVPFSNEEWFDVEIDNEAHEFEITYESLDLRQHNDLIKEKLLECERQKLNIVVFPELAMNQETESEIRNVLTKVNFQHLKLIFLGSLWNNKNNEAVLMSSQGTVLLREKKKSQYRKYSKEKGFFIDEAIEIEKRIQFIDVEGIGRIAYLICADFNEEIILSVCAMMHVDLFVVSAYTRKTNLMIRTASDNAIRKGRATILCNSCAAIEKEDFETECVALGVVPKVVNRELDAEVIGKEYPCGIIGRCEGCIKTFSIV